MVKMKSLYPLLLLISFFSLSQAVDGEDSNSGGGGGGGGGFDQFKRTCPKFRCTKGLEVAPQTRVKFESTGCNSMGSGMMMTAPGSEKKTTPYDSCCDLWHACYQTCGSSKNGCDDSFKTCSESACGADEDCKRNASIQHLMATMGDCKRFDEGQMKACECVKEDKVDEKRIQAIRNFYKKASPDSVDKAEGLAKKADTPAKFAALLRKLLTKYPKIIQQKEDPSKRYMDDLLKNVRMEDNKKKEDEKETEDDADEVEEHIEL